MSINIFEIMNDNEIWDSLKKRILSLSEIESIEPKDCKILSLSISQKTKKEISETTLKRIFGFAASHFEASFYTRNVLAKFCGYTDWSSYKSSVAGEEVNSGEQPNSWEKIKVETAKVNLFMLEAVKNKAVIPFHKMIEREFIYHHFQKFDESGALATVLSAPTGYGKTISICQWIYQRLSLPSADDIILYFNSSFILSSLKSVGNLNYWMMKMTGLAPSADFQQLTADKKVDNAKFYFVIDGFDEFMYRKNQFEILTHLLADILSIYSNSTWFRVVVIMRDSTWLNWKRQLMTDSASWFIGDMNDQGQNVGLFNASELKALMRMEKPLSEKELISTDLEQLRFPLFHSYFYKKYKAMIRYHQYNEVLGYELATDYMSQNILYGNQAINKIDFIFHLLGLMEYIDGIYIIDKTKINLLQKGFLTPYSTLIQIGFIKEIEKTTALQKRVFVQFGRMHFLGCCVAAYIQRNNSEFSVIKLEYIQKVWAEDPKLKIRVLKWCLFQSLLLGKQKTWLDGYYTYLDTQDLASTNMFMLSIQTYHI